MTVTEKSSRKLISGTGWTNPLTHDFELENSTHLKVYADDTLLVLGVNYTVSGVGSDSGYSVTISTPGVWTAVSTWVLSVEPPISQADDISLGGTYGARFEDGLDALTRRVQRLRDDARRAFKAPRTTVVGDAPTMDVLAEGEFWVADADGNMVRGGDAGDIANAQGYASAAAASAVDAQTAENGAVVAQLAAEAAAASATIFGTDVLAAAPGAAENYVAGTVFSTAGKSVSGDGGGGRWLVAASDPGNTLKLNLNGSGKYAKSLEKVLRPAHFGAVAGGTDQQQAFIDMASEIRWRAANGGGVRVEFDDYADYGIYDTTVLSTGNVNLMDLGTGFRGIALNFNGSRLRTANTFLDGGGSPLSSVGLNIILGIDLVGLRVRGLDAAQTAYTELTNARGIRGLVLGGASIDVEASVKQTYGIAAFQTIQGGAYSELNPTRELDLNIDCNGVYYSVGLSHNGCQVDAKIHSRNGVRSLIAYNVYQVSAKINSNPSGPFHDVLLKVYGYSTSNDSANSLHDINIDYTSTNKNTQNGQSLIDLQFQQTDIANPAPRCSISNIKLNLHVTNGETYQGTRAVTTSKYQSNLDGSGFGPDSTGRSYRMNNIEISGYIYNGSAPTVPVIDMFYDTATFGDFASDNIYDVTLKNLVIPTGEVKLGLNCIKRGFVMENVTALGALTYSTPASGTLDASRQVSFSNFKSAVASNMTAGSSGYRRLPNGRVEIFGVTTAATNADTVVAFPLTVTQVEAVSLTSANSGEDDSANAVSFTTAGFTISTNGNWAGGAAAWRALARI